MPPNMANKRFQQHNTRGQRRPFTRTPGQTRPFSRGRSATRSPHQSRPFTRSPHQSRPFTRSPHQSRPFTRSPHQSRPFSRSPHQGRPTRSPHQSRPFTRGSQRSRPYNRNNDSQPEAGSKFQGQSFNDRNKRGSFRSDRGARTFRGTRSSFRTTRGARSSFQTTRGDRSSFQTTRGDRSSFRTNRGSRGTRSSFNTSRHTPYTEFSSPHEQNTFERNTSNARGNSANARGNFKNARGNAANAQHRLAANNRTQGIKRKIPASTQPALKIPKTDTLEKKQRTIFVGNVPLKTTEQELKKIFAKYGTIKSMRFRAVPRADLRQLKKVALIKKNFHAKRNAMNAYVVYSTKEEAEKAQQANGIKFKEHCLRVNISTMTRPTSNKQSIFVGNLPFDIEDDDLIEIFKDCGPIESVRISREKATAIGRGFGFVNFETIDGVELALQMENVKIKDRVLRITRADTKIDQYAGAYDWVSVKINDLPQTTSKATLTRTFEKCGEIINITFNVKSGNKKSAVIAFRTAEAANKALDVQLVINNKNAVIRKDSFDPHKHIFIRNVPLKAQNLHVKSVLDKCGVIKGCKLLLTPLPPYTAGFGIVEFETVEGARNALELNTFKIMGNDVTIESYVKDKPKHESESDDDDDTDDDDDSNEEQQNGHKKTFNTEEETSDSDEMEDDINEMENDINKMDQDDDDDDDEDSEDSDDEENEVAKQGAGDAGQANEVAGQEDEAAEQEEDAEQDDDTGLGDEDADQDDEDSSDELDDLNEEEDEELEEEEEEDDDNDEDDLNFSD